MQQNKWKGKKERKRVQNGGNSLKYINNDDKGKQNKFTGEDRDYLIAFLKILGTLTKPPKKNRNKGRGRNTMQIVRRGKLVLYYLQQNLRQKALIVTKKGNIQY